MSEIELLRAQLKLVEAKLDAYHQEVRDSGLTPNKRKKSKKKRKG